MPSKKGFLYKSVARRTSGRQIVTGKPTWNLAMTATKCTYSVMHVQSRFVFVFVFVVVVFCHSLDLLFIYLLTYFSILVAVALFPKRSLFLVFR